MWRVFVSYNTNTHIHVQNLLFQTKVNFCNHWTYLQSRSFVVRTTYAKFHVHSGSVLTNCWRCCIAGHVPVLRDQRRAVASTGAVHGGLCAPEAGAAGAGDVLLRASHGAGGRPRYDRPAGDVWVQSGRPHAALDGVCSARPCPQVSGATHTAVWIENAGLLRCIHNIESTQKCRLNT